VDKPLSRKMLSKTSTLLRDSGLNRTESRWFWRHMHNPDISYCCMYVYIDRCHSPIWHFHERLPPNSEIQSGNRDRMQRKAAPLNSDHEIMAIESKQLN
jgi:hypothetical protein